MFMMWKVTFIFILWYIAAYEDCLCGCFTTQSIDFPECFVFPLSNAGTFRHVFPLFVLFSFTINFVCLILLMSMICKLPESRRIADFNEIPLVLFYLFVFRNNAWTIDKTQFFLETNILIM